ncbi:hypothetical protein FJT64_009778 [Amphibalanus amphitrite]|uniref:Smoothelin domain-containing protein n=1 Tax=Amphibalanus amphitrite TaxID=1232801 RepID=A0A6A4VPV9_AMPAM|nr:hypothetical protein FJT64_009778 [Amphibalanus amphitrite]
MVVQRREIASSIRDRMKIYDTEMERQKRKHSDGSPPSTLVHTKSPMVQRRSSAGRFAHRSSASRSKDDDDSRIPLRKTAPGGSAGGTTRSALRTTQPRATPDDEPQKLQATHRVTGDVSDRENQQIGETERRLQPVSPTATDGQTARRSADTASFLGDRSKVTGIRDVLSRMDASNSEVASPDDAARSLLNKFLGAQVMMTGMESMMAQSASSQSVTTSGTGQRPTTSVRSQRSQFRACRDQDGQWQTQAAMSASASKTPSATEAVVVCGVNISEVTDQDKLHEMLEQCDNFDERKKIRARLMVLMQEAKARREQVQRRRLQHQQQRDGGSVSAHGECHEQQEPEAAPPPPPAGLLPLVYSQLTNSLRRDGSGSSTGAGGLTGFGPGAAADSGTESGEDVPGGELSHFMDGLQTSLSGSELAAPPRLVSDVVDALAKLKASLSAGPAAAGSQETIDIQRLVGGATRPVELMTLIDRLQMSLQPLTGGGRPAGLAPAPTAPPPPSAATAPTVPTAPTLQQRLPPAGRGILRRQRRPHTVGITREEFSEIRRSLDAAEALKAQETANTGEWPPPPPPTDPTPWRRRLSAAPTPQQQQQPSEPQPAPFVPKAPPVSARSVLAGWRRPLRYVRRADRPHTIGTTEEHAAAVRAALAYYHAEQEMDQQDSSEDPPAQAEVEAPPPPPLSSQRPGLGALRRQASVDDGSSPDFPQPQSATVHEANRQFASRDASRVCRADGGDAPRPAPEAATSEAPVGAPAAPPAGPRPVGSRSSLASFLTKQMTKEYLEDSRIVSKEQVIGSRLFSHQQAAARQDSEQTAPPAVSPEPPEVTAPSPEPEPELEPEPEPAAGLTRNPTLLDAGQRRARFFCGSMPSSECPPHPPACADWSPYETSERPTTVTPPPSRQMSLEVSPPSGQSGGAPVVGGGGRLPWARTGSSADRPGAGRPPWARGPRLEKADSVSGGPALADAAQRERPPWQRRQASLPPDPARGADERQGTAWWQQRQTSTTQIQASTTQQRTFTTQQGAFTTQQTGYTEQQRKNRWVPAPQQGPQLPPQAQETQQSQHTQQLQQTQQSQQVQHMQQSQQYVSQQQSVQQTEQRTVSPLPPASAIPAAESSLRQALSAALPSAQMALSSVETPAERPAWSSPGPVRRAATVSSEPSEPPPAPRPAQLTRSLPGGALQRLVQSANSAVQKTQASRVASSPTTSAAPADPRSYQPPPLPKTRFSAAGEPTPRPVADRRSYQPPPLPKTRFSADGEPTRVASRLPAGQPAVLAAAGQEAAAGRREVTGCSGAAARIW